MKTLYSLQKFGVHKHFLENSSQSDYPSRARLPRDLRDASIYQKELNLKILLLITYFFGPACPVRIGKIPGAMGSCEMLL